MEERTAQTPEDPSGGGDGGGGNPASAATEPDSAGRVGRTRIRLLRSGIGVAVVLAVLAGAAYPGWLLFQNHRRDAAATAALATARDYAVTLTSADPGTVDEKITAIIDGATGDFKDRYTKSSAQLRKLLIDNQVTTAGRVLDDAVKSATPDRVEVLLVVEQSVRNAVMTEPGTDLTPVAITMTKVDGAWLASDVTVFGSDR